MAATLYDASAIQDHDRLAALDRLPGSMLPAESGEAVATLALAGFGIGVLASVFMPPDGRISYIPLEGVEPLSYGIYHPKEVDGLTRRFISLLAHPS